MQIRWEADALADLSDLRSFIEQDNPSAANHTAAKILDTVNLLATHPFLGKAGRIHTTRELVVASTPYTIIYLVEAELITVLRVFHQVRQWKNVLSE